MALSRCQSLREAGLRQRSYEEYEALRDTAQDDQLPEDVHVVDWKESIATVLGLIDRLLAPHGLEVVTFDTGADDYAFKIEPKQS